MTSVSAIITTHNRCEVLPRAIESVMKQTRAADEIIIINDGSTDTTTDYLSTLPTDIKIIEQDNLGISAARNTAIRNASSDWLAFLDDDDEWLPHKLEQQLNAIQQQPEFLLCHSEEIWIRRGKRVNAMNKHKKQGGWIYPNCLPLCVISPSAVMIHKDIFQTIGVFDTGLPACEDYDLWLRLCAQHPVLFIDEPLIVKHGGHDDQLSRKHWGMDRFRIQALEKMLNNESLTNENRQLTLEMLNEKLEIYLNGAKKRGKQDEVYAYRTKLERYSESLKQLQTARAHAC